MKKVLLFAILSVLPCSLRAACCTVVQTTGNTIYTIGTSSTQAFGSNNTSGNTLVVTGFVQGTPSLTATITDSLNTWAAPDLTAANTTTNSVAFAAVLFHCAAGANTVTVTGSVGTTLVVITSITEISGATAIDQNATDTNVTNGTDPPHALTTSSITTTAASIVIAMFRIGNDPAPTLESPLVSASATPTTQYSATGYLIEDIFGNIFRHSRR